MYRSRGASINLQQTATSFDIRRLFGKAVSAANTTPSMNSSSVPSGDAFFFHGKEKRGSLVHVLLNDGGALRPTLTRGKR